MKAGNETEIYKQGYRDGYNDAESAYIEPILPKIKDGLSKDDPDYWTRLKHTYAGMAMQGILSNPAFPEHSQDGYYKKNVVNNAYEYAHALVEKMKEAFKIECK